LIGLAFDEALMRSEDDEFNLRLSRAGGLIWQSPRIKSWYHPRASLRSLWRQYVQYGYWKVRVIQKHSLPASIRHLVPAAFVVTMLTLPLAALFWPWAWWLWGPSGCSISLGISPPLWTQRDGVAIAFPRVTGGGCLLSLGYGYGFLRGLWDFIIVRGTPAGAMSTLTR
jgi:GT2 family glycosyltransferase